MYEVKKFNVLSLGKISAVLTAVVYFVFIGIYIFIMLIYGGIFREGFSSSSLYSSGNDMLITFLLAFIGGTLVAGVAGFVGGLISAALYNFYVKITNQGVQIDIVQVVEEKK